MSILFFAFSGLPFAVRGFSSESWYYSISGSRAGLDLDLGLKGGREKNSAVMLSSRKLKTHAVVVVLYVVLKAVPIGKRELIGTAYHWGLSFNGEDNARVLLQP